MTELREQVDIKYGVYFWKCVKSSLEGNYFNNWLQQTMKL